MSNRVGVFEGIDFAAGTDRGYHVAVIGPDATQEDVQAFRDAYELGYAWAETEDAMPSLWATHRVGGGVDHWNATATADGPRRNWTGEGPTPAAALRALAAKLRD